MQAPINDVPEQEKTAIDDAFTSSKVAPNGTVVNGEQDASEGSSTSPYSGEKSPVTHKDDTSNRPRSLDVKCGPLVRYLGMANGTGAWRGTILIVTADNSSIYDTVPVLTYKTSLASFKEAAINNDIPPVVQQQQPANTSEKGSSGPAASSSTNTLSKQADKVYAQSGYTFWRFYLEIPTDHTMETKVTYSIPTSSIDKMHSFYISARQDSMRLMFFSCNGFSLGCKPETFKGQLWDDVIRYHEKRPFHLMIGGGDQIYSDAVKVYCPLFKEWTQIHNTVTKHTAKFTDEMRCQLEEFYLHHYLSWFGRGYFSGPAGKTLQGSFVVAEATIPTVNMYDDHDIIDGFGSYHDLTMRMPVFSGLGNVAFKYYMLFQHHSRVEPEVAEPSWVFGPRPGPYIHEKSRSVYTRLGARLALYALDCRTERTHHTVAEPGTYQAMFDRLKKEIPVNGEIRHLILLLGIPIAYPRLVFIEQLLTSKIMVPLKLLRNRFKGSFNEFDDEIEVLDDLEDHWCAANHKKERNWLVKALQRFAGERRCRITILSGDVHLGAMGRFKSKDSLKISIDRDYRLIVNVISSAIVNTPPPPKMVKFLCRRNKLHHLSENGDEDLLGLFETDVNGKHLGKNKFLMGRRNWCLIEEIGNRFDIEEEEYGRTLESLTRRWTVEDDRSKLFRTPERALVPLGSLKGLEVPQLPSAAEVAQHEEQVQKQPHDKPQKQRIAVPDIDEPGALLVSLYVEKDQNNSNAETVPYSICVPILN